MAAVATATGTASPALVKRVGWAVPFGCVLVVVVAFSSRLVALVRVRLPVLLAQAEKECSSVGVPHGLAARKLEMLVASSCFLFLVLSLS